MFSNSLTNQLSIFIVKSESVSILMIHNVLMSKICAVTEREELSMVTCLPKIRYYRAINKLLTNAFLGTINKCQILGKDLIPVPGGSKNESS